MTNIKLKRFNYGNKQGDNGGQKKCCKVRNFKFMLYSIL